MFVGHISWVRNTDPRHPAVIIINSQEKASIHNMENEILKQRLLLIIIKRYISFLEHTGISINNRIK